jgi:hypothetical protein
MSHRAHSPMNSFLTADERGCTRIYQKGLNQTGCGCPLGSRSLLPRSISVRCHLKRVVGGLGNPLAGAVVGEMRSLLSVLATGGAIEE